MTIWAIVPVKSLPNAKSRLSDVLSREERAELSADMFVHTIEELNRSDLIERTLVVSKDSDVLSLARSLDATTLMEHGASDLNRALNRATAVAKGYGASGVLVLPADLPHINVKDIEEIVSQASDSPIIAIAPDRHRRGTNALLSVPPGLIEYEFGPRSFDQHLENADQAGVRVKIIDLPSFAFDLDWPEDLELLREENAST